MPERIQLSRKKGWRMPPNTVSVARPGKWGNPFKVGPSMTAAQAVSEFHLICIGGSGLDRQAQRELRGKNLACWCPLDAPCHADVLLELANAQGTSAGTAETPQAAQGDSPQARSAESGCAQPPVGGHNE